jgi:hypothetical protein
LDAAKDRGHVELVGKLECFDMNWVQSERQKNANSVNAVLLDAALVAAAFFQTLHRKVEALNSNNVPNANNFYTR